MSKRHDVDFVIARLAGAYGVRLTRWMAIETLRLSVTLGLWSADLLLLGRPWRGLEAEVPVATPRVSVIIPVRNEEHHLPLRLRSPAAQPAKPLPDGWRGKA
jgi:hypothetical protein